MKRLLQRTIARCGREATVTAQDGAQTAVRALIQPVRAKSRDAMAFDAAGAGLLGPEQYVYLGPAEVPLAPGDSLTADGEGFLVRRAERLYYKNEALYVWGLLTRQGGDADWTS